MADGQQKAFNMDLNLSGKKILITGSSRGMGSSIAKIFLDEGADIAITSRYENNLITIANELQSKYGESRCISSTCDCSNIESLENLRDFLIDKWSRIDIVIANVGDGKSTQASIQTDEDWLESWNSNFETALQTTRIFTPHLITSKGNILFISSIAGLEAFGAPVSYSTAKSALIAFAKNIARKLANDIRVNVIAPGNIIFPGGTWDEKLQSDPDQIRLLIKDTVPMNRFGTPEEIASAAAFLCSEKANFITGSVLVIDGGQTVGIFS